MFSFLNSKTREISHTVSIETPFGFVHQKSPIRLQRRAGYVKREKQASGQITVCTCHHMDIYRNAATRRTADSAPTLSKPLQQRETPGAGPVSVFWSRAPCAGPSEIFCPGKPAGSSGRRETNQHSLAELFRPPSLWNKTLMRLLWKCFILLILMPSRRE